MFGCVSGEIAVVLENGVAFEDAVIEDDAVANIAIFRVSVLFSGEFEGLKVAGSSGGREDREGREEYPQREERRWYGERRGGEYEHRVSTSRFLGEFHMTQF